MATGGNCDMPSLSENIHDLLRQPWSQLNINECVEVEIFTESQKMKRKRNLASNAICEQRYNVMQKSIFNLWLISL